MTVISAPVIGYCKWITENLRTYLPHQRNPASEPPSERHLTATAKGWQKSKRNAMRIATLVRSRVTATKPGMWLITGAAGLTVAACIIMFYVERSKPAVL